MVNFKGDFTVNNIWQEGNDYGKLEPLTDEIVKQAEGKLEIKLPTSYISILKQQNGGYIKFNTYPLNAPVSMVGNYVNVDHIFGIGMGKEKGILESKYLIQEWELPDNIVLISGDGHSWIALDYRTSKIEPPVILIDAESNEEIQLAKDFEEFINGLMNYTEESGMDEMNSIQPDMENRGYYTEIDEVISKGTPKEIDRVFTKILSTNNELIRYMVEKLRKHEKPKVHFNLLLFLSCCAEGDNKGILEDNYLNEVLLDLSKSKNKDVKDFAQYSLTQLHSRLK
ncbi:SMI1/KNR4 family protein [Bacillus selenatarsenatis]|uniref:SMI1/KNR4 family protein n=1 Tax=Mesobacillus selenatarsenatis TaxID=388741 RepID=A0A846TQS9_9BACI|nr:SMI1/KNR4 family protein [Mesobacillus selenatarsenatis]NKE08214.1 SMI1/KNR4 family protein [Mesobacillus selenatarsenatis]